MHLRLVLCSNYLMTEILRKYVLALKHLETKITLLITFGAQRYNDNTKQHTIFPQHPIETPNWYESTATIRGSFLIALFFCSM